VNLLVVRHGIAEDREVFGRTEKDDDLRPLTDEGRKKMARGAQGLRTLVPALDLIASSPLVRAQQTAAIVAKAYGISVGETTRVLEPDAPLAQFAKWIETREDRDVIAVVGHEPHLSALVTWLMAGVDDSRLELKKGGACLLEFTGRPHRASAVLQWLHTPATLRRLAE
jgi:phosphohistidine phosphatase